MNRVWATVASYFGPVALAECDLVECFEKRNFALTEAERLRLKRGTPRSRKEHDHARLRFIS